MDEHQRGYRILIADDDANVHQSLGSYFRREGYQLLSAYDGEEAVRHVRHSRPDMMLLDIMMPKMDGLVVCREVRKSSNIPIIMLTAKGEEFDKLLGLELGADDYIAKPFSPREVLARVKAVLRRMYELKDTSKDTQLVVCNLDIDMGAFIVKLNGQVVPCTPKEIEILWTLAGNPGMVFSREHLLQSIWGYDFLGDTRAVDSHIKRIRAKLCIPENPWDIKTVWGVGYRFEVNG
ncbi:MAG: response regulator transcription factor [Eubacteriales bacterium]|nr:response regulator transcription factor [Christensenellaceae bacterium]MEA5067330.1 response regulator transcription factor [Eubacteriales bacterium]